MLEIFKKAYCAECGAKTGKILSQKLVGEQYLCSSCSRIIPNYMSDTVKDYYTLDMYHELRRYAEYSKTELEPVFKKTHEYREIILDEEHGLFKINHNVTFPDNNIVLCLKDIEDYRFSFEPTEYNQGIFIGTVTGIIYFEIQMNIPPFYVKMPLVTDAKVKAKENFMGTKVSYRYPDDLVVFDSYFAQTYLIFKQEAENETYSNSQSEVKMEHNELRKAMSLFMIDDISAVTEEELKSQRNRLIKTFHPDGDAEIDAKYSQKINDAYNLLKDYIKR